MKRQYTTTVRVAGKGETKGQAFAAALSSVQNSVLKSTQNVLLRIEPEEVQVLRAEERIKREKFLFFFLPRDKKQYFVELDITVNVTIIDIDKVDFFTP